MDYWTKSNIAFLALCIISSVLVSVLTVLNLPLSYDQPQTEIVQTATQHVTIGPGYEDSKTNLNTATKTELMGLPGVGEVLADRIISKRPFEDVWELLEVEGIGTITFSFLKDLVVV